MSEIAPTVNDRDPLIVVLSVGADDLKGLGEMLSNLRVQPNVALLIINRGEEPEVMEILKAVTPLPIVKVSQKQGLEEGGLYLIQGEAKFNASTGLVQRGKATKGHDRGPLNEVLSAIASRYRGHVLGVFFSSNNGDGLRGAADIQKHGGVVITCNDQLKEIWEGAGDLVFDHVAAAADLGSYVTEWQQGPSGPARDRAMQEILKLLNEKHQIDLSHYKPGTIHRRIERRMNIMHARDLAGYSRLLASNNVEVDTLVNDLLINVTSFFRDERVFQGLNELILPDLLTDKEADDPLRIWIAGCSTGEEVVSIAITVKEFLRSRSLSSPVQIFATDLDEIALGKARKGVYSSSSLSSIPSDIRDVYFTKVDGRYQVVKAIRDMCVFARHDLTKDPPFSKLDLVSCQNVLIYLSLQSQGKIMHAFHYGLKPTGYLILGRSETPSAAQDLFQELDPKFKIYRPMSNKRRQIASEDLKLPAQQKGTTATPPLREQRDPQVAIERLAERVLLEHVTPPALVIDRNNKIILFHGDTSPFLRTPKGKPTLDLLKLVHKEIVPELRALLRSAHAERQRVERTNVVWAEDSPFQLDLEIMPLAADNDGHFMVIFRRIPRAKAQDAAIPEVSGNGSETRIHMLERQLSDLREQMSLLEQEYDQATEELRSANEDVVSSNEELQSINEELETSKEELQSINEEFATINEELQERNDALRESEERKKRDAQRLQLTIDIADLGIWSYDFRTRKAEMDVRCRELYGVGAEEVHDEVYKKIVHKDDQEHRTQALMKALDPSGDGRLKLEYRVINARTKELRWIRNMGRATFENGVPVHLIGTVQDISEQKTALEALQASEQRFRMLADNMDQLAWIADAQGVISWFNGRWTEVTGLSAEEILSGGGTNLFPPDKREQLISAFDAHFRTGRQWEHIFQIKNKDGEYRWYMTRAIPVHDAGGSLVQWFGTNTDITESKAAEAALLESEERFRMLADNMDQLAWMANAENRASWFNKRWQDLTGLSGQEIRENGGRHLYHPDDKERLAALFPKRLAEGKQWEETFRLMTKDGEYRWFLSRAIPIRDEHGTLIRWFGTNTDITESKRAQIALQESEERFRLMADNMDQLAWIGSADGSSFWFNKRYEEFTGWPTEQIPERAKELHHPDHYQRVHQGLSEAWEQGIPWEDNFPLKRKDGTWRWFLARALPSSNAEGDITRWFCTCTDITERREAEEALKEADQRKDRFLAILAHELRSPLAPLRNGMEILSMLEPNDPEGERVQAMMQRQLKHMVRLIDDLMDLSRISREMIQLELAQVHLQNPVDKAIEAVRPVLDAKNIAFSVEVEDQDLYITGDETRLTQVINNLLHNAAKYTPEAGSVTLRIARDKSNAVLTVTDNGIGIDPEMLPKVFGIFTQVDSAQSTTGGGLGIGLHIVKRLVEMHGGNIHAHSEGNGKGCTFTVMLPLAQTTANEKDQKAPSRNTVLPKKRILVVDDNTDSADSMAAMLRVLGQVTYTANDGEAAVEVARKEKPDLILMDIGMPRMNGYEACEQIRSEEWGRKMVVIALTGWGLEQDRERSKKAGFDHHLVKPVAKDKLLEILQKPVRKGVHTA